MAKFGQVNPRDNSTNMILKSYFVMSVDDLNYILVYPERMRVSVFGVYANHVRTHAEGN